MSRSSDVIQELLDLIQPLSQYENAEDWPNDYAFSAAYALVECRNDLELLHYRCQQVVDRWQGGDLAGAVRDLAAMIGRT